MMVLGYVETGVTLSRNATKKLNIEDKVTVF